MPQGFSSHQTHAPMAATGAGISRKVGEPPSPLPGAGTLTFAPSVNGSASRAPVARLAKRATKE